MANQSLLNNLKLTIMKSLKNQKCVVCGKPATMWLNEDDIDVPYCGACFDREVNLGSLDEEEDDYCPETMVGDLY